MKTIFRVILLSTLACFSNHSQAATYVWNASSGLYPDQVPTMTLFNSSSPEDPLLSGGALILGNDSNAEQMYYDAASDDLAFSDPLTITTEVRVLSSTTINPARAGAGITFSTAASIGNMLCLDDDEIFLLSENLTRGSTALVNTNSFHTYRIEVAGILSGSSIMVYQDDVLLLTGELFTDSNTFGSDAHISFGEISGIAGGTSEWRSFTHTVSAVPEPTTSFALPVVCLSGLLLNRRRRR